MSGLLTHPPAQIVQYLMTSNLSLGSLPSTAQGVNDWPIFAQVKPDDPDRLIVVNDTMGESDGRSMIDGEQWEHHGIIITVRADNQQTCFNKARTIKDTLDKSVAQTSVTVVSSIYLISAISTKPGPIFLGFEEGSKRVLYTINAVVEVTQTA